MTENQRKLAETVFERHERRETEINNAMKQEHARREAAVKNIKPRCFFSPPKF